MLHTVAPRRFVLLWVNTAIVVLIAACGPDGEQTPSASDISQQQAALAGAKTMGGSVPRRFPTAFVLEKPTRSGGWAPSCQAILVSPNIALTAGHCIKTQSQGMEDFLRGLFGSGVQVFQAQHIIANEFHRNQPFNLKALQATRSESTEATPAHLAALKQRNIADDPDEKAFIDYRNALAQRAPMTCSCKDGNDRSTGCPWRDERLEAGVTQTCSPTTPGQDYMPYQLTRDLVTLRIRDAAALQTRVGDLGILVIEPPDAGSGARRYLDGLSPADYPTVIDAVSSLHSHAPTLVSYRGEGYDYSAVARVEGHRFAVDGVNGFISPDQGYMDVAEKYDDSKAAPKTTQYLSAGSLPNVGQGGRCTSTPGCTEIAGNLLLSHYAFTTVQVLNAQGIRELQEAIAAEIERNGMPNQSWVTKKALELARAFSSTNFKNYPSLERVIPAWLKMMVALNNPRSPRPFDTEHIMLYKTEAHSKNSSYAVPHPGDSGSAVFAKDLKLAGIFVSHYLPTMYVPQASLEQKNRLAQAVFGNGATCDSTVRTATTLFTPQIKAVLADGLVYLAERNGDLCLELTNSDSAGRAFFNSLGSDVDLPASCAQSKGESLDTNERSADEPLGCAIFADQPTTLPLLVLLTTLGLLIRRRRH